MVGMKNITLESLDRSEALRYMGYGETAPDEKIMSEVRQCEKQLLAVIKPCFVYKVFDTEPAENGVALKGTTLILKGRDISEHLKGCEKCVLFAATLSFAADMLIRRYEATDMTKAVIADFLASAAVEQVCDIADKTVRTELEGYYQTWRFSPGYGDLPIDIQGEFLDVIDAGKRIGLNVTTGNILTPRKSVTAVIGLSKNKISKGRQGCALCNMKEVCQFRKRGEHCAF